MLSSYQNHYNNLYNKLVELSRNIFLYREIKLKDNFETRINLIFVHLSLLLIIIKKRKKDFPQKIFDNIFLNIEYHIRELGYGDVTVNKKMKILTRIFYDILLKIKKVNKSKFEINHSILCNHLSLNNDEKAKLLKIDAYLCSFYKFCFELNEESMLKVRINFKHK